MKDLSSPGQEHVQSNSCLQDFEAESMGTGGRMLTLSCVKHEVLLINSSNQTVEEQTCHRCALELGW